MNFVTKVCEPRVSMICFEDWKVPHSGRELLSYLYNQNKFGTTKNRNTIKALSIKNTSDLISKLVGDTDCNKQIEPML